METRDSGDGLELELAIDPRAARRPGQTATMAPEGMVSARTASASKGTSWKKFKSKTLRCKCTGSNMIYLYDGKNAVMGSATLGISTAAAGWVVDVERIVEAICFGLIIAGLGALVTALFVRFRCSTCYTTVTPSGAERFRLLRVKTAYFVGGIAAIVGGAAVFWYERTGSTSIPYVTD